MLPPSSFAGQGAENRGDFRVVAPVNEVFPLFGAQEESKWAPGWRPLWIFPGEADAKGSPPRRGWVFKTNPNTPEERTWYVETFDLARHEASYIVFWPNQMVYRIEIQADQRGSETHTRVTYSFRGLSPEGNHEVERRTSAPATFAAEMKEWADQISAYLARRP